MLVDGWSLLDEIYAEWLSGGLVAGVGCDAVEIGDLITLGPEGGVAGWRFCLTIALSDTTPFGS